MHCRSFTSSEGQRVNGLLQEERDKSQGLEEIIQGLELEITRVGEALQLRDKSVSSLQFEKAALNANLERLKGSESSAY